MLVRPHSPRDHDIMIVTKVVSLLHARRTGDYLRAAAAHWELLRLGVELRFPRHRKGVANRE